MTLTQDQTAALEAIDAFLHNPDANVFLLEGGAGTGKTFLLGQLLKTVPGMLCCCTPTHKATNVLRRKLDGFNVRWTRGYDAYSYDGGVITGTTAQLLGTRPVVADDQDTDEVKFGKTNFGLLNKFTPALLVIDEVSMLGFDDLKSLVELAKSRHFKILAVGDAGQLPPVKRKAIPFDKFKHHATLRQVVRQAEGSPIIKVAWNIREGRAWDDVSGPGIVRADEVQLAFLEAVKAPTDRPEEDREVFIAYTNKRVDAVQELACQKLYGHSRKAFAEGELVLSETNYYEGKELLCANQDELVVLEFHSENPHPVKGVPVTLRHRRGDSAQMAGEFDAYYLAPEELANKDHPFNVELRTREKLAKELQEQLERGKYKARSPQDEQRKAAWRSFFEWRDQTIISFRHPFAITSHKSQGSTYREVYVDVPDIARFSSLALYVAVTRPREKLVVPLDIG